MYYYRWITTTELFNVFRSGVINPKEFEGNEDSTIPSGKWSFWYGTAMQTPGLVALVRTEEVPDLEGTGQYWQDDTDESIYHRFSLPEYTYARPVKVVEVWVSPFVEGEEAIEALDDENHEQDPEWFWSDEVQNHLEEFAHWVDAHHREEIFDLPFPKDAAYAQGMAETVRK